MSSDGAPECDLVLKIIMVGDSGVGKSCLLKSFMGDPFQQGYNSTIGVDFEIKPMNIDGRTVNLQIWDTAGQERFRTITTSYYRISDAVLMVFDVTASDSFANLRPWLEDVRLYARENVDVLVVGNKVDLKEDRQVDHATAKEFCDRHGLQYIETSAKRHVNVEGCFLKLAHTALQSKLATGRPSASGKSDKSGKGGGGAGSSRTVHVVADGPEEPASGCRC